MPQINPHTKHGTLDCAIQLTLPRHFVREWNASVGKQQWIADISRHDNDDEQLEGGKMGANCNMGSVAAACREIDVPALLETNMSVVADSEGREKTCLSLKLTGVQLHVHEGTLQITVLDVKSKGMDDVGKAEPDASMVPEDTTVQGQASPDNFSVERQTSKTTDYINDQHSTLTGSGSRVRRAGAKRKRAPAAKGHHDPGVGSDTASAHLGGSGPSDKPSPAPLHSYGLRGKKLSFAKFGAYDYELDLKDADGGDHPPQLRPLTRAKKLRRAQLCVENNGDPATPKDENKVAHQSPNEHRQHSRSSKTDADTETETDQYPIKTVPSALSDSVSSLLMKRTEEKPSSSLSESSMVTGSEQPSKRRRMKIDIQGLPSFPRRGPRKGRKASCRYCGKRLIDPTGVMLHVRKWHSGEEDLEQYLGELKARSVTWCSLCHARCETRLHLQRHEDTVHFKTGAMQCKQCGKVFPNTALLKQHVRSVHLTQGQAHCCPLCLARFKWAATLKTHLAEVHHHSDDGAVARSLACQVCGKTFQRRSQLNRHGLVHAPPSAALTCQVCGRGFRHGSNLRRHADIVHGAPRGRMGEQEAWHCAYCGSGFGRREGWTNHVEKVHLSLFPHSCGVCRAGFTRRSLLEKHLTAKHGQQLEGVEDFQAAAPSPGPPPSRLKHGRAEEEEEAAACGLCGDRFRYKARLVRHIFSAHRHIFPFACDLCPQVFMERAFLLLHGQRAHQLQQPGPEDAALDTEEGEEGEEGTEEQERTSGLQQERTSGLQQERTSGLQQESTSGLQQERTSGLQQERTSGLQQERTSGLQQERTVVVPQVDRTTTSTATGESSSGGGGVGTGAMVVWSEEAPTTPTAESGEGEERPVQYVIHIPEELSAAPPHAILHYIAGWVSADPPLPQEESRAVGDTAVGHQPPPCSPPLLQGHSAAAVTGAPQCGAVPPRDCSVQAYGEGLEQVLAPRLGTSTATITDEPEGSIVLVAHGDGSEAYGEVLEQVLAPRLGTSTATITDEPEGSIVLVAHGDGSEAYGEVLEQVLAPRLGTSTATITDEPEGSIVLVAHGDGSEAYGEVLEQVLAPRLGTSTATITDEPEGNIV